MAGAPALGDAEITALFGEGNMARRTLFQAWLQEGLHDMGVASQVETAKPAVVDLLKRRLRYNEPVIGYLPEVSTSAPCCLHSSAIDIPTSALH